MHAAEVTPHRACVTLATLPVPLYEEPAVTFMDPMVRHPPLVRMRVLPVAGNPHVLAAFPAPVTGGPNKAGLPRRAVRLHANRRRGSHGCGGSAVAARRRPRCHDASAECDRKHGNCYQPA